MRWERKKRGQHCTDVEVSFHEVNLGFVHYEAHGYCLNSDCCFLMNYNFNYFYGHQESAVDVFFSSLYCLTLFIKKDFLYLFIKSIIYCRPLEISRDNCKAKKSAFSLLLEILECFFS